MRILALLLGLVGLPLALAAAVEPPPLPQVVSTLDGRYNALHTWQADFTQIYTSGLETRTESGRLYLEKPGRMRWDYTQPVSKQFIVNGKRVWQYTAGDNEASVTAIQSDTDLRTPLRFLLGHTDLGRELAGLSFSGLDPWQPGDTVICGEPRAGDAAGWREVWIEFTPAYEIDRLVIAGEDGSQNDIRLSHIEANAPIGPHWFNFTPPPGVKVVPAG